MDAERVHARDGEVSIPAGGWDPDGFIATIVTFLGMFLSQPVAGILMDWKASRERSSMSFLSQPVAGILMDIVATASLILASFYPSRWLGS